MRNCCINSNDCKHDSQYWYLTNYFGISGYFCSYHYGMISHDAYDLPTNKEGYEYILSMRTKYISEVRGDL